MSGFTSVFFMASLLGAASFGAGMLALSFTFSQSVLAPLTSYGSGLLLGAALGVVIPEGIEAFATLDDYTAHFPTSPIALSLLAGFIFMLVVERLLISHPDGDHGSHAYRRQPSDVASVEFDADVELGDLERTEGQQGANAARPPHYEHYDVADIDAQKRAYPLTVGLFVHALADGLALASAALFDSAPEQTTEGSAPVGAPSGVSTVVFFALVVHKAPTALALATSLLSTGLPISQCKRHLAIFSAATPLGALLSFVTLYFFGAGGHGRWTGTVLLFSGGSFLYVATVLQPAIGNAVSGSGHDSAGPTVSAKLGTVLLILGMVTPYCIGTLLGEGHGH